MVKLFSPVEFKGVRLKNRIAMSPMCMYSSVNEDGMLTPFHVSHYVSRAVGQVGLVTVEATAVQPEGRISKQDLGIWQDEHISGFKRLNKELHQYGTKTSIQLGHAGRKAELDPPIYAPSALAFAEKSLTPVEMSKEDIQKTISSFKEGARRAREANFDIVEIHAAHGYLINQFLSPLTNQRIDEYGGSKKSRYRLLNETIKAVKKEWQGPLFVRISANEYHKDGNTKEDFVYFAKQMKAQGVDLVDCSSGAVVPAKVETYPGYQVRYSEKLREKAEIATGAVGLITTGIQAEEIVQNQRADLVFIGRSLLRNPYWAKAAADELGYNIEPPEQYARGWNRKK
ncbi:NADPH dehydrogenase [Tetragenococcus halophilus subsp. flandriensis]|uniref:NADPH dehydrogenase NamA n=1 Tax=Tetragenococcus halophilus TaxID=51669 RepID=UPI0023EA1A0A|nr:NADPH dehydrogenase NamA [Tetragenococcus halophilus]GMA08669.1 NADPH dehydrogenase [Tetragenococcus halophilus subsp. flandriensis]